MQVGIIGLGNLGKNILKLYNNKKIKLYCYDKYINGGLGSLVMCLKSDLLFLCLPTDLNITTKSYKLEQIYETCKYLHENNYKGLVIIKSNIEPHTINNIYKNII